MDEQLLAFLATIWGEAAGCAPATWRAIASVILNRVGKREWRKLKTPLRVIAFSGFDAYAQQNAPFLEAWRYFPTASMGSINHRLEDFYHEVEPTIAGRRSPTTDAVLYYSPKAQAALHAAKPGIYRPLPRWNFDELVPVVVPGTEADDFAWFKYREPAQ